MSSNKSKKTKTNKKNSKKNTPRSVNKEWLHNLNLRYEQEIDAVQWAKGAEIISVPFFSIFFDIDDYYYELTLKWEPKTFVQDELTRVFEKQWLDNPAYQADVALNTVLSAMLTLKKNNVICWKGYRAPVRWKKTLPNKKTNGQESEEGRTTNSWTATDANNATDVRGDEVNEGWDKGTKERKKTSTTKNSKEEIEIQDEGGIISFIWGIFK